MEVWCLKYNFFVHFCEMYGMNPCKCYILSKVLHRVGIGIERSESTKMESESNRVLEGIDLHNPTAGLTPVLHMLHVPTLEYVYYI